MYRQKWAEIVYGRSYHLDFRFIAIPRDFTSQEIDWASPYILATTRKARNLAASPRWSLFKNDSYCVLGVTCMVRDLIGDWDHNSRKELTKDDRGRPLYVFVGYVTKLEYKKCLFNLPSYTGNCLEDFQSLYQYVREVWLVKNFDRESKKPKLTDYQKLIFTNQQVQSNPAINFIEELNHQGRYSDKVFLWQNTPEQNRKLWAASAIFPKPISICLGIDSTRYINSPFLNQTLTKLEQFTIQDRIPLQPQKTSNLRKSKPRLFRNAIFQGKNHEQDKLLKFPQKTTSHQDSNPSLPNFIAQKAKQDINVTLQHVAQAATLGQELIDNFVEPSTKKMQKTENKILGISAIESSAKESKKPENFGFKTKPNNKPATETKDWF